MKEKTITRQRFNVCFAALLLVLLAAIVSQAEAGMAKEQMAMTESVRSGILHGAAGHMAAGTATLSTDMKGTVLTLSDIRVDKVPDGRVYLAKGGDHRQGIELGKLTQFSGSVSFALPETADPADFDQVVIWCEKFNVEIGRASLVGKGM